MKSGLELPTSVMARERVKTYVRKRSLDLSRDSRRERRYHVAAHKGKRPLGSHDLFKREREGGERGERER